MSGLSNPPRGVRRAFAGRGEHSWRSFFRRKKSPDPGNDGILSHISRFSGCPVKFQNKLMLTYSMLVVLLVVVLAVVFYRYSSAVFERNARENYELLAPKLSSQIDNMILPMDFISINMISDAGFKSALATLESFGRNDPKNDFYINEARFAIREQLSSYSIFKYFHRVIVFNQRGDFFSSAGREQGQLRVTMDPLPDLPWMPEAIAAAGKAVIASPYVDLWKPEDHVLVYSRVRSVPGLQDSLGFIEVQNRFSDLESVLVVPGKEFVRILVLKGNGEVFFRNGPVSKELAEYYYKQMLKPELTSAFRMNPLTRDEEALIASPSKYSDLTVLLVLNKRSLLSPLRFMRAITVGIALFIVLFSVLYTWISSRQLSKPLRLIQERMEDTDLSNLPQGSRIDHPNDEIVALDRAFGNLTARLSDSIRRELDARTLWMQARLDSLQAQVNPHFINNILTVIANRGFESGDERIGEICNGVASMLRYSTSTEERYATLQKELEHVETYLFLMKQRLESKLSYDIRSEPAILDSIVPKIVMQQIVENSISHGYRKNPKTISIGIRSFVAGNYWRVEMTDDGDGFDSEALASLNGKIAALRENLIAGASHPGMGFGGLGLLNTYSRLYLFYKGDFVWELGNGADGGACITIGGPLAYHSSEAQNAGNTDS